MVRSHGDVLIFRVTMVIINKRAVVALEHSPEFLALEALLLHIIKSFEQYKENRVS